MEEFLAMEEQVQIPKWEYIHIIAINTEGLLNQLGADGWEVVCYNSAVTQYLLKRMNGFIPVPE